MWTYRQKTGELLHNAEPVARGYSGHGLGLDNPTLQEVRSVGPIPQGRWLIGAPYSSPRVGPFVLPLRPDPHTETFGRSDFLIHGDNRHRNQSASRGCIILNRAAREAIHDSDDTELEVTA